jgi:hypothetical protein
LALDAIQRNVQHHCSHLTSLNHTHYEPRAIKSNMNPKQSRDEEMSNKDPNNEENNTRNNVAYDVEIPGRVKDTFFCTMFMETSREYDSLDQLNVDMDLYEQMEGICLIIKNSDSFSRIYRCATHIDCCFRAKFGRVQNGDKIILKEKWTNPYHSGRAAPPTAKGQVHKKHLKGRIEKSVAHPL